MKNFKSVKLMVVAMLLGMAVSSCGSDDDDVIVPGGSDYTEVGVHRIDVKFSDNITGMNSTIIFSGINADGSYSKLYENGNALDLGTHNTWYTTEIRDVSIETDNRCAALTASVLLISSSPVKTDQSVTTIGYINGRKIATKVFTLPSGKKSISLSFVTEGGGKSGYVIDGEVIE